MNARMIRWLFQQVDEWERANIITSFQKTHIRTVVEEKYRQARAKYLKLLFWIMVCMAILFLCLFGVFW